METHRPVENTTAYNPATGEQIGTSPLHSPEALYKMIDAARAAQEGWASQTVSHRVRAVKKIQTYLVDQADELAEIISRDNGKPRIDALATEIIPAAAAVAYYCRKAHRFLKVRSAGMGALLLANKRSRIHRAPYGVIGIISPWNYPFAIPFSEVIMGLLSGNAVVLKTATETQMAGLALKSAIEAAEIPEGLFHFVNLPGRVAGETFLAGGVDKLFFTGSVAVGKILMQQASATLTPVCLELGGNDAMIVCEDADLDRAAAGALWGGFQNAGQSCGGVERIYVHESVMDAFLDSLKKRVETMRVGCDRDFNVDMGAMTTSKQVEAVRTHVEDALEQGAFLFARSPAPEGEVGRYFHPAMVLTRVHHGMRVMQEETFGPVVGVMEYRDIETAIALANDSSMGLTGSVWSRNRKQAERIARRIRAGAVTINDHLMSHGLPETPWGGFKESGIGRTHGDIGFAEMTQPQVIVHDLLGRTRRNLWWHPYNHRVYNGLRGALECFYGDGWFRRMKGARLLGGILPRIFRN